MYIYKVQLGCRREERERCLFNSQDSSSRWVDSNIPMGAGAVPHQRWILCQQNRDALWELWFASTEILSSVQGCSEGTCCLIAIKDPVIRAKMLKVHVWELFPGCGTSLQCAGAQRLKMLSVPSLAEGSQSRMQALVGGAAPL